MDFLGILTYASLVGSDYKVIGSDHKLVLGSSGFQNELELVCAKGYCEAGLGRVVRSGMPILLVMYGYVGR